VRRSARRAAIGLASVLFALFVVFPIGFAYVGTHAARPPVDDIDLGNVPVEQVQLHTSDGLTLEGSYVPSKNGAGVVVAFGRKGTQRPARMLARHGYGVLIFDRRGEGESDGDPNPYDAIRLDIGSAVSACPCAARHSCKPRHTARTCRPSSPRAPAPARRASCAVSPAAVSGRWRSTR
jgi:hypothetical protein